MYRSGRSILEEVRGFAEGFDPTVIDAAQAKEVVEVWTKIRNIAAVMIGLGAARVDETGAWQGSGCADGADWLARNSGTSKGKAREQLKTAERLNQLESTSEAAKKGELSEQQLDAISDAATANPEKERQLLDASKLESVGELKTRCAKVKAAADPDPDATQRRIHANRGVRRWSDADGTEHLHANGPRDAMARLDAALKPLVEELFGAARAEGNHESEAAYHFDALIRLADGEQPAEPVSPTRRRSRHRAVLRIDLEALVRGSVDGDETCEIAGLGPISISTARSLLGDSILHLVLTKGADVANVTYLGRGPSGAQKVALLWQMPECSRLGCPHRAHLEVDHRTEFSKCRQTRLPDLDPLCWHDHDLKTYKGWALVDGSGKRPMVPPDHPDHPRHRRPEPAMAGRPPP